MENKKLGHVLTELIFKWVATKYLKKNLPGNRDIAIAVFGH